MSRALPLVSIGMPVYNGMKFLHRALDSLVAQDYPNFELVICDNASTDGTSEVCAELARRDPRVRHFVNETNVGILPNFALAIERSQGEYFMWAAYDDLWMPGFVSAMVERLEANRNAVVAMSRVQRNYESGAFFDVVSHTGDRDPSRLPPFRLAMHLALGRLYHLFFYGLFRREFLRKAFAGFPKIRAGDRVFMIQCALAGGFEYDDRLLHIRSVSDATIAEKYATDELGRFWKDPFAIGRMLVTATGYLFRSPVVPARRKLLIPILILVFGIHSIYATVIGFGYRMLSRILGPRRRRAVGNFVRRLTGRAETRTDTDLSR